DPANANGGKWVISLRNPQLLDRCWTWLVYSLVGEELDEHDDICGAGHIDPDLAHVCSRSNIVMSRRSRGDRIAVWVRDKDNVPVINGIGRRLLKILDLQNENSIGMDFQFNEDALKSGTSYNNRVYLSLESLKQELEKERLDELSKAEKEQNNDADNVNVPETPKTEIKVTTPDEITTNVDVAPDATNNEETPQEKENKKDD
ncbi:5953_t:CDS:2, partial [Acaulospora morrowiae]